VDNVAVEGDLGHGVFGLYNIEAGEGNWWSHVSSEVSLIMRTVCYCDYGIASNNSHLDSQTPLCSAANNAGLVCLRTSSLPHLYWKAISLD
jgi:hypothetical protein